MFLPSSLHISTISKSRSEHRAPQRMRGFFRVSLQTLPKRARLPSHSFSKSGGLSSRSSLMHLTQVDEDTNPPKLQGGPTANPTNKPKHRAIPDKAGRRAAKGCFKQNMFVFSPAIMTKLGLRVTHNPILSNSAFRLLKCRGPVKAQRPFPSVLSKLPVHRPRILALRCTPLQRLDVAHAAFVIEDLRSTMLP